MSTYPLANKLRPFPCGKAIGLSFHGRCFRRCECGIYAVEAREENSAISWHCKGCGAKRLVQQQKSDKELLSELLENPHLRGWEILFIREQSTRLALGTWQRKKLKAIAERLGIGLECNCSLSEVEGGAR